VAGNHDIFKLKDYLVYFEDVKGSYKFGGLILSHYPVHPESLPGWCLANCHGHTHDRELADPRYKNLCPEVVGPKPVNLDYLLRNLEGADNEAS
jgi:calcineurin-like phosphoesterase family protein